MQLKDVMTRWDEVIRPDATRGIEVVRPDTTLQAAAEKMRALCSGIMPVCDGGHLVGILTDRDITVRAIAAGRNPRETKVRDIMTPDLVYCFEDQEVEEAATVMKERQIRRLPVLNREKQLVGIVSLGDLATSIGNEALAGKTLEGVSQPVELKR